MNGVSVQCGAFLGRQETCVAPVLGGTEFSRHPYRFAIPPVAADCSLTNANISNGFQTKTKGVSGFEQ